MEIIECDKVIHTIKKYPVIVQDKLYTLRRLILQTASGIEEQNKLREELKWGEPAYTTKYGSTIRIDWKEKTPDQYAIYFHCKTNLIETFKEVYQKTFKYDGRRAILFDMEEAIPIDELKQCIKLSLTYHKRKKLPMLGI